MTKNYIRYKRQGNDIDSWECAMFDDQNVECHRYMEYDRSIVLADIMLLPEQERDQKLIELNLQ